MGDRTIVTKKPPYKETIGAQYYCFNKPDEGVDFDETKYEDETNKEETVKQVTITENAESAVIMSSGKAYDTRNQTTYVDIEVEKIATDADDLARMRGDLVDTGGLIQTPISSKRPFFAYGKVVELSGNNRRYDWYPKCQLIENTDETKTRGENFEEQTDTLRIRAYAFDKDQKMVKNSVDTSTANFPEGLTEEQFFKKPIITKEDLASATTP